MLQAYRKNDDRYILTYQLNQNDINIFFKMFNKLFLLQRWFICLVSFYCVFILLFPTFHLKWVLLFISSIVAGVYFSSNLFVKNCTKKAPGFSVLIHNRSLLTVDNDCITIDYLEKLKSIVQWRAVIKIIEKKDYLYIHLETKNYLIIPCYVFETELDKTNFIHFVKTHILLAKEQDKLKK
ncbi:YcxB family protein [Commensalibacter communis]|uniref:YcxB family protein n=1 Tax=Commensalibacter communis TaxID=2972786 RepID=UPI0022FFB3B9|nr:YcxB family protein [Commensalibacter communis]CAI3927102.1 unnamed protein product [Commensalibacter communis]CAI3927583.1 unnamed protein product [Commensalibacter communis]